MVEIPIEVAAEAEANRGGPRFKLSPSLASAVFGIGGFLCVHLGFIAAGHDEGYGLFPKLVIGGIVAAAAFFVVRENHRNWDLRYERALRSLRLDEALKRGRAV